jgi:hypothetical protein
MACPRPNILVMTMLFGIGVISLFRSSENLFHLAQNVRLVDVVGLSGGGVACGAAMFGTIFSLVSRNKG